MLKQNASSRVKAMNTVAGAPAFPSPLSLSATPQQQSSQSRPLPAPLPRPTRPPVESSVRERMGVQGSLTFPETLDASLRGAFASLFSADLVVRAAALSLIASTLETAAQTISDTSPSKAVSAARLCAHVALTPAGIHAIASVVREALAPLDPDPDPDAAPSGMVHVAVMCITAASPRGGWFVPLTRAAIKCVGAMVALTCGPVDPHSVYGSPSVAVADALRPRGPYTAAVPARSAALACPLPSGDAAARRDAEAVAHTIAGPEGILAALVKAVGGVLAAVASGDVALTADAIARGAPPPSRAPLAAISVDCDTVAATCAMVASIAVVYPDSAAALTSELSNEIAALEACVDVPSLIAATVPRYPPPPPSPPSHEPAVGSGTPLRTSPGDSVATAALARARLTGRVLVMSSAIAAARATRPCATPGAPTRRTPADAEAVASDAVPNPTAEADGAVCCVHTEGSATQSLPHPGRHVACEAFRGAPLNPVVAGASPAPGSRAAHHAGMGRRVSRFVVSACGYVSESVAGGAHLVALRTLTILLSSRAAALGCRPEATTAAAGTILTSRILLSESESAALAAAYVSAKKGAPRARGASATDPAPLRAAYSLANNATEISHHAVATAVAVAEAAKCALVHVQQHARCAAVRTLDAQHNFLAAALNALGQVGAAMSTLTANVADIPPVTWDGPLLPAGPSAHESLAPSGDATGGECGADARLDLACEEDDSVATAAGTAAAALAAAAGAWIDAAAALLALAAASARAVAPTDAATIAAHALDVAAQWTVASLGNPALCAVVHGPILRLASAAAGLACAAPPGPTVSDGATRSDAVARVASRLQPGQPIFAAAAAVFGVTSAARTPAAAAAAGNTAKGAEELCMPPTDECDALGFPSHPPLGYAMMTPLRSAIVLMGSGGTVVAAPVVPRAVPWVGASAAAASVLGWAVATGGPRSPSAATVMAILSSPLLAAGLAGVITGGPAAAGRQPPLPLTPPSYALMVDTLSDLVAAAVSANAANVLEAGPPSPSSAPAPPARATASAAVVASNCLALLSPRRPPPHDAVHAGIVVPLAVAARGPRGASAVTWRTLAGLIGLAAPADTLPEVFASHAVVADSGSRAAPPPTPPAFTAAPPLGCTTTDCTTLLFDVPWATVAVAKPLRETPDAATADGEAASAAAAPPSKRSDGWGTVDAAVVGSWAGLVAVLTGGGPDGQGSSGGGGGRTSSATAATGGASWVAAVAPQALWAAVGSVAAVVPSAAGALINDADTLTAAAAVVTRGRGLGPVADGSPYAPLLANPPAWACDASPPEADVFAGAEDDEAEGEGDGAGQGAVEAREPEDPEDPTSVAEAQGAEKAFGSRHPDRDMDVSRVAQKDADTLRNVIAAARARAAALAASRGAAAPAVAVPNKVALVPSRAAADGTASSASAANPDPKPKVIRTLVGVAPEAGPRAGWVAVMWAQLAAAAEGIQGLAVRASVYAATSAAPTAASRAALSALRSCGHGNAARLLQAGRAAPYPALSDRWPAVDAYVGNVSFLARWGDAPIPPTAIYSPLGDDAPHDTEWDDDAVDAWSAAPAIDLAAVLPSSTGMPPAARAYDEESVSALLGRWGLRGCVPALRGVVAVPQAVWHGKRSDDADGRLLWPSVDASLARAEFAASVGFAVGALTVPTSVEGLSRARVRILVRHTDNAAGTPAAATAVPSPTGSCTVDVAAIASTGRPSVPVMYPYPLGATFRLGSGGSTPPKMAASAKWGGVVPLDGVILSTVRRAADTSADVPVGPGAGSSAGPTDFAVDTATALLGLLSDSAMAASGAPDKQASCSPAFATMGPSRDAVVGLLVASAITPPTTSSVTCGAILRSIVGNAGAVAAFNRWAGVVWTSEASRVAHSAQPTTIPADLASRSAFECGFVLPLRPTCGVALPVTSVLLPSLLAVAFAVPTSCVDVLHAAASALATEAAAAADSSARRAPVDPSLASDAAMYTWGDISPMAALCTCILASAPTSTGASMLAHAVVKAPAPFKSGAVVAAAAADAIYGGHCVRGRRMMHFIETFGRGEPSPTQPA